MNTRHEDEEIRASAAAISGKAVLITGRAGAGKTTLLVELISRGAKYIGDDLVILRQRGGVAYICAHPKGENRFEMRGLGIYQIDPDQCQGEAPLALIIDLDHEPRGRLPEAEFQLVAMQQVSKIRARGVYGLGDIINLLLTDAIKPVGGWPAD